MGGLAIRSQIQPIWPQRSKCVLWPFCPFPRSGCRSYLVNPRKRSASTFRLIRQSSLSSEHIRLVKSTVSTVCTRGPMFRRLSSNSFGMLLQASNTTLKWSYGCDCYLGKASDSLIAPTISCLKFHARYDPRGFLSRLLSQLSRASSIDSLSIWSWRIFIRLSYMVTVFAAPGHESLKTDMPPSWNSLNQSFMVSALRIFQDSKTQINDQYFSFSIFPKSADRPNVSLSSGQLPPSSYMGP